MGIEEELVSFAHDLRFQEIPSEALTTVKNMLLTVLGTTVAGAEAEGCGEVRELYQSQGGAGEATVMLHGNRLPAQNAATINGMMARALDYCDAMAPGLHIGSSVVPAALASVELAHGLSGSDLLTALTVGTEISSRLNLQEADYNGFDPTGVAGVFSATAAACRILGLGRKQTWHALALASNRCGATFQSNIDGSLAVRLIQGWVAGIGVDCARLAQKGITGPKDFLEGVYGYFHLFAKDQYDPRYVAGDLGRDYRLNKLMFKKYPSCGLTLGVTDLTLGLVRTKQPNPADIAKIRIRVPPYAHKLVGHPFKLGDNPRVNAQFSIQYCVASALVRGESRLSHFEPALVKDPAVAVLIPLVEVVPDPALDQRGHTSVDLEIEIKQGELLSASLDIAPGFPGNPLTSQEHLDRFWDCIDFSDQLMTKKQAQELIKAVDSLPETPDARLLVDLMTPSKPKRSC